MIAWEECPTCGHRCKVRVGTDGSGRLTETADWCPCERRRRGVCLDCDAPVETPRAHRCAEHRHARLRAVQNASKRRARADRTPEQHAALLARTARWREENRERIRAYQSARKERYAANARAHAPRPGTDAYERAREKDRERYVRTREHRLAYARAHYAAHREQILAYKAEEREMRRRIKAQRRAA